VLRALVPLGAGHALAVAAAIGVVLASGFAMPLVWLRWPIAIVLVLLGVHRFVRHRHPRRGGMRVSMGGLTVWSFFMATAHGAGLMVLPLLVGDAATGVMAAGAHAHHQMTVPSQADAALRGLQAAIVHGAGYLLATGGLAVLVYERLGVGVLRRAWINLDVIWAAALVRSVSPAHPPSRLCPGRR
jgi:hypothetical protein